MVSNDVDVMVAVTVPGGVVVVWSRVILHQRVDPETFQGGVKCVVLLITSLFFLTNESYLHSLF